MTDHLPPANLGSLMRWTACPAPSAKERPIMSRLYGQTMLRRP